MDPATLKQYLPLIKRVASVNLILITYYVMPNFASFVLVSIFAALLICPSCVKECMQCEEGCKVGTTINQLFTSYLDATMSQKLLVVVGLGLTVQLNYLLPNWLILLLITQAVAFWDVIVSFGGLELLGSQIAKTDESLNKLFHMIPRYEE